MPISNFPAGLKTLIQSGLVRSFPILDLTLGDGTQLHLSTVPVVGLNHTYDDLLGQVGNIKTSIDRSVDRCEITIDNADLTIGDIVFNDDEDERLDKIKATLSRLYIHPKNSGEVYEVERLAGFIYTYTEDDLNKLKLTLISDAYAGGGVAPFSATKSCTWQYKDGINCDYSGGLPTCDLTLDGINGCIAHFGTDMAKARFGGGTNSLSEAAVETFAPSDPGHPGYCFIGNTKIYTDGQLNSEIISRFTGGGQPILSIDKETFAPSPDKSIRKALVGTVRQWNSLLFSDGSVIEVTDEHPFLIEGGNPVRVRDMEPGMKFRRLTKAGWRTVRLVRKQSVHSFAPVNVYNVPVKGNHTYFANGFPVSNRKDDNPELPT